MFVVEIIAGGKKCRNNSRRVEIIAGGKKCSMLSNTFIVEGPSWDGLGPSVSFCCLGVVFTEQCTCVLCSVFTNACTCATIPLSRCTTSLSPTFPCPVYYIRLCISTCHFLNSKCHFNFKKKKPYISVMIIRMTSLVLEHSVKHKRSYKL